MILWLKFELARGVKEDVKRYSIAKVARILHDKLEDAPVQLGYSTCREIVKYLMRVPVVGEPGDIVMVVLP